MSEIIPILDNCSIRSDVGHSDYLIMDFREYWNQNPQLTFPHRHNFYHMVYFTEGKGHFTIDFRNFTISPNQVYFMIPGQVHTWDFNEIPHGYLLNFSSTFFDTFLLRSDYLQQFSFMSGEAAQQVIEISPELVGKHLTLLQDLLQLAKQPSLQSEDLVRVMLLQFFLLIDRQRDYIFHPRTPQTHVALLKNFKNLIEQHFREEKFPAFYAEKLNISSNHLNQVCKNLLGQQAGELIRERVVLEAKRLLIHPSENISAIAYHLNFNDNSYFTKFFKKSAGMSPEQFRKKYNEQNRSK